MATETMTVAEQFQRAYDHFNKELFDGNLPGCLITLREQPNSNGYFSHKRFSSVRGDRVDEIAMNSTLFATRSLEEVLSTLAHEMVHLWQYHYGDAGRGRYHNKEWADKMLRIGLHPTDDMTMNGKMVGDQVTHIILPSGAFKASCSRLLASGFELTWHDYYSRESVSATKYALDDEYRQKLAAGVSPLVAAGLNPGAVAVEPVERRAPAASSLGEEDERPLVASFALKEKKQTRVKYSCPECGVNAWGGRNLNLVCGECNERLEEVD